MDSDRPLDHGISRAEMLILLSASFFGTLKEEIAREAKSFGQTQKVRIDIEEVPSRLILRGDQCSLDVTLLPVERETVRLRYGYHRQSRTVDLKLDVSGDALVLRDQRGDVIQETTRFIAEPFLRGTLPSRHPAHRSHLPRW